MMQFNLLPDLKLQYIRAERTKHTIMLISFVVSAAAVTTLVLLFVVVNIAQKKHLNDVNADVKKYSKQLQDTKDLGKVLTIQNQLNNLPALQDAKPVASRLFSYISQVTPAKVSIAKLIVDYSAGTIQINGAADSLATVNTFADTLKFSTYVTKDNQTVTPAFSEVVLATFGRDDKGASYSITFKYDPAIFSSQSEVTLTVPKKITTRSETEKPTDLFQPNSNTQGQ